jgi:hypothetical protein
MQAARSTMLRAPARAALTAVNADRRCAARASVVPRHGRRAGGQAGG